MLRDDDFGLWYLKDLACKVAVGFHPFEFCLTMRTCLWPMRDHLIGVVYLLQRFAFVSRLGTGLALCFVPEASILVCPLLIGGRRLGGVFRVEVKSSLDALKFALDGFKSIVDLDEISHDDFSSLVEECVGFFLSHDLGWYPTLNRAQQRALSSYL